MSSTVRLPSLVSTVRRAMESPRPKPLLSTLPCVKGSNIVLANPSGGRRNCPDIDLDAVAGAVSVQRDFGVWMSELEGVLKQIVLARPRGGRDFL